ncbi:PAS domain-containing protein [Pigmentiphaga aceris]|uniref:PAS domain-containing protein n=1 Tax=Pigmentiphaga aceris TaxID=1940612 RepID=A0A5C0B0K9_9BURK|nr:PAS domain-containing protein [Pigmentiphaga aceris]QEI06650.1 PAS domain-containing protein [Pigmentiphaga aceris]
MPAFSAKSAAARTLDDLLAAREVQRARGSLLKTWGTSLDGLTLSPSPQPFYTPRSSAVGAELANCVASLSLRLAQAEAARDCLRVASRPHAPGTQEGMWEVLLAADGVVDPASRFWWSPEFRSLLGFDTAEEFPNVLGSWASHVHADDIDGALDAFAAHLDDRSGATPFDVCYRMRCKDGEYRWFRARGQARRAADGTPMHALGVLLAIPAAQ